MGRAATGQPAKVTPDALVPLEYAVCRILTVDGPSSRGGTIHSGGSGCLFHLPGRDAIRYVLTCHHVIAEARGAITVTWDGVTSYPTKVLAANAEADLAILTADSVPREFPAAELMVHSPVTGDTLYCMGFGGASENKLGVWGGTFILRDSHDVKFYGWARSGDSGGPVFIVDADGKGKLLTALWGSAFDRELGHVVVRAGRPLHVQAMLGLNPKEFLRVGTLPPKKAVFTLAQSCSTPLCRPHYQSNPYGYPFGSSGRVAQSSQVSRASQQQQQQSAQVRIRNIPGPAGPAGPAGMSGKDGTNGTDGTNGKDANCDELLQRIAGLEALLDNLNAQQQQQQQQIVDIEYQCSNCPAGVNPGGETVDPNEGPTGSEPDNNTQGVPAYFKIVPRPTGG